MAHRNLRLFMNDLRQRGELVEVAAPVDSRLEIAEIHRRVIAAGGPALLFRQVIGKSFPVVTNLFGTKERVDLAFGARPRELIQQLVHAAHDLMPPSLAKVWGLRGLAGPLLGLGPKRVRRAPVLAHQVPGADLTALPALTSWQEDGGPFLTLPLVHTRSPDGGPDNLGMYRIQIHDRETTGLHFQIGKGGGFHLAQAEALGKPLPVNIYLGGPPALMLAAIAPLPENIPELLLAGLVLGERLGRAPTPVSPLLDLVAEAEFCLAGFAPPGVRQPEGPFGDHYGYYSLVHDFPIFKPKAIYHRPDAVFPATVVGKPRQEDFYIGDYLQELLLPLFPLVMPAVKDLWSFGETGYHALAAAVLKERFGRESLSAAFRILGEGQLALTKFLIGVDHAPATGIRDIRGLLAHVLARVDWARDLFVFADTAMDTLDYAGPKLNRGSKGLLLATGEPRRQLAREFQATPPSSVRDARVFAPGCLVVAIPPYPQSGAHGAASERTSLAALAGHAAFKGFELIIAVDDAKKATATDAAFLWTTFTRFDPAADLHAAATELSGHKVTYRGPVVIDARMKPWYPAELVGDPETAATVTRRWREYFPDGNVAMGASDDGHLLKW